MIGRDSATIGRILLENGYRTSWFGKDHNTPTWTASQAGPFDQWPTGMGFEYFYGFVGGDASQWEPNLFRNTTPIYPYVGQQGKWNLTTAMADDAIHWLNQLNDINPDDAVLPLLRAGRHPCAAPSDAGMGRRRSPTCICSTRAGTRCATRSSPTRRSSASFRRTRKLTPWPDKLLKTWDTLDRRGEEALHPSGERLRRLSGLHRPRDRPGDPGGRRTWASSTTR